MSMNELASLPRTGLEIAIVGMVCHFPGAGSVEEFWQILRDGREAISAFTEQELEASGVSRATYGQANYVRAGAVLEEIEWFDAAFFGYSPREAAIIDPQQRLFLECAWEALENAGYDPEAYGGLIGVYAGAGTNSYLAHLYSHAELVATVGNFQIGIGNDKEHLTTRVAYKLNLQGPAVTVQ